MQEPKNLTDAELVEAVAREVMHWYDGAMRGETFVGQDSDWCPIIDMNDLFMVLEKVDGWQIIHENGYYECTIITGLLSWIEAKNKSLPRAVLEACLSAERGKE